MAGGMKGWFCAKGTVIEPEIQERLERGAMKATGDYCSGPPSFTVNKNVENQVSESMSQSE
jgi:hypothetical protein